MARFGTVHPPKGLFLEAFLSNFVEPREAEVRRIHIPRTPVNKGKKEKKGRDIVAQVLASSK